MTTEEPNWRQVDNLGDMDMATAFHMKAWEVVGVIVAALLVMGTLVVVGCYLR
jgi:hypothetical protein